MKRLLLIMLFLSVFLNSGYAAESKNTGIGLIVGEPTGLSFQHLLSNDRGINGGAAYSFQNWFQFWMDYIFLFPDAFKTNHAQFTLAPYFGLGGLIWLGIEGNKRKHNNDSLALGARIPLGLQVLLSEAPLGFFVELVPGLQLIKETDFILQGGIGARLYF